MWRYMPNIVIYCMPFSPLVRGAIDLDSAGPEN
jgi:hypothetical protein